MVFYIENPKGSIKKKPKKTLLELIHKFSNVVGYKINTQKNYCIFYTNNNQKEKFNKLSHLQLFPLPPPRNSLGINLTMEVKDLYIENYKTLMKEI